MRNNRNKQSPQISNSSGPTNVNEAEETDAGTVAETYAETVAETEDGTSGDRPTEGDTREATVRIDAGEAPTDESEGNSSPPRRAPLRGHRPAPPQIRIIRLLLSQTASLAPILGPPRPLRNQPTRNLKMSKTENTRTRKIL